MVSVQGQAEEVTVIIRIIVFDGEFFFLYFLESGFLIKQMCSVRILGGVENDSPLNVLDRNGQQTDKKLQINDLWLFLLPESPASKTSKVR